MKLNFRKLRYYIREYILRKESKKGNFTRYIIASFLTVALVFIRFEIPDEVDSTHLIETFYKIRGKIIPPYDLVLINIDDQTYKKLGISHKTPFPRDIAAKALHSILDEKPKLVILDLNVPESADEHEATIELSEALKRGPTSISLSPVTDSDGNRIFLYSAKEIREAVTYETSMIFNARTNKRQFISLSEENNPEPVPLLRPLREQVNPDLNEPGQFDMINYYGPPGTIRSFSLLQFFSEERTIPKEFFKDKIVVIGFNHSAFRERGTTSKEVFFVPIRDTKGKDQMYGVEIHANIVGNLLNQEWIKRLQPEYELVYLIITFFLFLIGVIVLESLAAFFFVCLYLGGWFIGTYIAFAHYNFFFPGVFFALYTFFIIGYFTLLADKTLEKREFRKLKSAINMEK